MTKDDKGPIDFNIEKPQQEEKKVLNFSLKKPEKKTGEKPSFEETMNEAFKKFANFCEEKLGKDSKVTQWASKLEIKRDDSLDALTQLKKGSSRAEKIELSLTLVLIIMLITFWKTGPGVFKEIDQLKNDLEEQKQVVKMEEQNNNFLVTLNNDRNALVEKIHKVYSAIPEGDEKAEEIIAMLEDMASKNRMIIESIGIREISETQFYYDDLFGYVLPYEYTFSIEGGLPNILSFIGSMRSSLRLMDIMSIEIEEGKESYKANFSVFAYHIIEE